jgi:hypothetical protein
MEQTLSIETIPPLKLIKPRRQYTQTEPYDFVNISNGRCPDYALYWGIQSNKRHWPKNHNFLEGDNFLEEKQNTNTNININTNIKKPDIDNILREILNDRFKNNDSTPILYIEIDNILADVDNGLQKILQKNSRNINTYPPAILSRIIRNTPNFFKNLEWTPNGQELWLKIKKYNPIILTRQAYHGIETERIEADKREWCAKNLGSDIRVITCPSSDKCKYCIHNSILIDSKDIHQLQWEILQGKFILYTSESSNNTSITTNITSSSSIEEIVEIIDTHILENQL